MAKYLTKEINLIVKDPRDSGLAQLVNETLAELSGIELYEISESGISKTMKDGDGEYIFELIDIKYHTQYRAHKDDMIHSALVIYAYHAKSKLVE